MPTKQKESGWIKVVVWIAALGGAAIGYALSTILGAAFWMPAITVTGAWMILSKCKVPHWAVPVLAIVTGHTAWVTGGLLILVAVDKVTDDALLSLSDIVIVGGLTFWVLKTRSAASCFGLLIYETISLAINGMRSIDEPNSMAVYIAMHVILRISGIAAAIYAIVKRRQSQKLVARSAD